MHQRFKLDRELVRKLVSHRTDATLRGVKDRN